MSTSPKLPPSARDFLVYQRLVIEGASTRTIAAEVGLSQTRVRQIVLRVTHWLIESLPASTELSDAALLRLGQYIAADRLEFIYSESYRAFQQTTHAKYANICLRVSAALTKLPALPGTLEALHADVTYGPLPDDTSSLYATNIPTSSAPQSAIRNPQSAIASPPIGACSPPPPAPPSSPEIPPSAPDTTPPTPTSSVKLPSSTRTARTAFLAPAHLPDDREDAPVTELTITPENLGLTTHQHSSRKQRRRLRRLAMAK